MNPSSNETSGMQLPPPVMEQAPIGNAGTENAPSGSYTTPERSPSSAERSAGRAPASQPMALPTNIPVSINPLPTNQSNNSQATQQAAAATPIADDNDLIEKEWVNKAKQIVDHTRNDPYKQSEELTGVKVDYMKKRYNKTIKLNQ